ncbi:hypothetical protein ACETU7_09525 [Rhodococcus sp. 3Y1]
MSQSLSSVGARVVVLARRPEQARRAVADLPGIEVRACDLSDPSSVRSCAREILESRITPDIIICNAGSWPARNSVSAPAGNHNSRSITSGTLYW